MEKGMSKIFLQKLV